MATIDEFEQLFQKHLGELITPVIQAAFEATCATGSGKLWNYISDLVIRGVDQYVYAVYKPRKPFYKRRSRRGGLGDPNNVQISVGDIALSIDEIRCEFDIANTTIAGTIYDYDDDGVLRAVEGDGGYIEDQILGGTGYKFHEGRDSSGSFRVPRNFYQVYDDEYDEETAGNIVFSVMQKDYEMLYDQAIERAFIEFINNLGQ